MIYTRMGSPVAIVNVDGPVVSVRHPDGRLRQVAIADLKADNGLAEIEQATIDACGLNLAGEPVRDIPQSIRQTFTCRAAPGVYTIHCNACAAAWVYPAKPLGAACLALLNHAAGHKRI